MPPHNNPTRRHPQPFGNAEADAAFPENQTSVVTLDASHAPFLSMPDEVAKIIGAEHRS